MLSYIVTAVVSIILYRIYVGEKPPRKMFDVYSQPGIFYYPKVVAFWLLIMARKLKAAYEERQGTASAPVNSDKAGYGVKSRSSITDMEKVQPLGKHPKSLDAVLFQGANRDGAFFVGGMARRPHHVLNGICLMKIPGLGTLKLEKHPDSTLFGTEDIHGGEGFAFTPVEPMKKWKLKFDGKMRLHESNELVYVNFDLTFESQLPYFDFDTDMNALTVARAMALETWTREFFERLRDAHQTHYEQIGTISGQVTVTGRSYPLCVVGMRDHSYANCRDWRLFHRYGLHTLIFDDGTKAQVDVVSQPYSFSRIELGYLYTPGGALHPLDWCDLQLGYHGEQGQEPRDYGFSFHAAGRTYHVLVQVQDSHEVYIGWDWEARLLERYCTYQVNGVRAWGVSEWYYRHYGERPEKHAAADPDWVKGIEK